MSISPTRGRRKATKGQAARLEEMGLDPADVGRIFNGPATATAPAVAPKRVPIPNTPAQLEAMLEDPDSIRSLFAHKEDFAEFISRYARTVLDKDQSIATQVREETQRVLASWLKEQVPEGIGRPDMQLATGIVAHHQPARSNGLYNPRAMGARIDAEFANSADYFRTIWHNTQHDAPTQAKLGRIRNAFSSTVPSEGGFLIPENLRADLLSVALESAIVRPRARVIPMESLRVPFPAIDETSRVSSIFGGLVGYWTEEGAALTDSSATFGRIVLDAKKLTMYTEVPNELISDSVISFQGFIDQMLPEALAFYEDDAFINGSGVGEPLGFLNANAAVSVTKETGQAASTVVWENIVKMYSRMLPSSLGRAVWICSIDTFPELATMALSVGTGGSAVWLNNGAAGPPMTILGRPVVFTEKTPTVGTVGDINFVDLGFYLVGDRQVMSATSSPHYKFGNDKTAYRVIERVDGRAWMNSAITPASGSTNTLSPFVKLATRA
jgi:HK97 family phage major capsid protein